MLVSKEAMTLYLVTDRSWLKGRQLADQVEEALKAGVTFLQLREKELPWGELLEQGEKLKALAARYKVPFVINDDVDAALALDADGVHIGQKDGSVRAARKRLGPEKILGVSAQTVEQALRAQADGADYLGVGAVFTTSTKKDANAVSYETVKAICHAVSVPVVAIGGINRENILSLQGTGVDGVAVISAILAAKDVEQAAAALCALAKTLRGKGTN